MPHVPTFPVGKNPADQPREKAVQNGGTSPSLSIENTLPEAYVGQAQLIDELSSSLSSSSSSVTVNRLFRSSSFEYIPNLSHSCQSAVVNSTTIINKGENSNNNRNKTLTTRQYTLSRSPFILLRKSRSLEVQDDKGSISHDSSDGESFKSSTIKSDGRTEKTINVVNTPPASLTQSFNDTTCFPLSGSSVKHATFRRNSNTRQADFVENERRFKEQTTAAAMQAAESDTCSSTESLLDILSVISAIFLFVLTYHIVLLNTSFQAGPIEEEEIHSPDLPIDQLAQWTGTNSGAASSFPPSSSESSSHIFSPSYTSVLEELSQATANTSQASVPIRGASPPSCMLKTADTALITSVRADLADAISSTSTPCLDIFSPKDSTSSYPNHVHIGTHVHVTALPSLRLDEFSCCCTGASTDAFPAHNAAMVLDASTDSLDPSAYMWSTRPAVSPQHPQNHVPMMAYCITPEQMTLYVEEQKEMPVTTQDHDLSSSFSSLLLQNNLSPLSRRDEREAISSHGWSCPSCKGDPIYSGIPSSTLPPLDVVPETMLASPPSLVCHNDGGRAETITIIKSMECRRNEVRSIASGCGKLPSFASADSKARSNGEPSTLSAFDDTVLVFVYGTLKRGYCNHYNMQTPAIVYFQDATTVNPYVLYVDSTNRSRPCLTDGTACPISELIADLAPDDNTSKDNDSAATLLAKDRKPMPQGKHHLTVPAGFSQEQKAASDLSILGPPPVLLRSSDDKTMSTKVGHLTSSLSASTEATAAIFSRRYHHRQKKKFEVCPFCCFLHAQRRRAVSQSVSPSRSTATRDIVCLRQRTLSPERWRVMEKRYSLDLFNTSAPEILMSTVSSTTPPRIRSSNDNSPQYDSNDMVASPETDLLFMVSSSENEHVGGPLETTASPSPENLDNTTIQAQRKDQTPEFEYNTLWRNEFQTSGKSFSKQKTTGSTPANPSSVLPSWFSSDVALTSKAWGKPVKGELYRVTATLLPELDRFERVPQHYVRETISVRGSRDGKHYKAEVYFNNTYFQRWIELLSGRFELLADYTPAHHKLYEPRPDNIARRISQFSPIPHNTQTRIV